jgi:hypothetical protein
MASNSKPINEAVGAANVAPTDTILVIRNPNTNPSFRQVPFATVSANIVISNTVPANSTSNGTVSTFCYDSNYLYVCVANNTWKRTALTTW